PMADNEELRLVVSLDDQASGGLARLKQEMAGLGGPGTAANLQTLRHNSEQMGSTLKGVGNVAAEVGKNFKGVGEAVSVARLGIAALGGPITLTIAGLTLLATKGTEAIAAFAGLREEAEKLQRLGQIQIATGFRVA